MVIPASLRGVALVGAWLALAAPAAAQSRRYPPAPVDKDAEAAAKSGLWTAASNPDRHPYQDLIHTAREALNQRTIDQTTAAIAKLDAAIQLLPHEPEAYHLRGNAYFDRSEWANCAADYAATDAYTQRDDQPLPVMAELHRRLGICQARAGKLADAEKTLAESVTSTVAIGLSTGETWMRLGEVRIAMGKLDEAISALRAALDSTEPAGQTMTHFLLATAYDRARRPADAQAEIEAGLRLDRGLTTLFHPVLPELGAGDNDYMLGLAYGAEPARPEWALAYFRRFVAEVPASPWRKRADEHIREIKAAGFPEATSHSGSGPVDLELVKATARRSMPQLRACLTRRPTTVVEIEITRAGPRTPAADKTRPRFFMAADGVAVHRAVGELSDAELEAITACLVPIAARLTMPAVKDRDTYYRASFYVVGP